MIVKSVGHGYEGCGVGGARLDVKNCGMARSGAVHGKWIFHFRPNLTHGDGLDAVCWKLRYCSRS